MTLRHAQLSDLQALAQLFDQYRSFYQQPSDLSVAQAFIEQRLQRGDSQILVVEQQQTLVGFCQLYPSFCSISAQSMYILSDLFVEPGARRQGHARLLLQTAADFAQREGRKLLELTTAKTNLQAQALYESLGWQRDAVYYTYHLPL